MSTHDFVVNVIRRAKEHGIAIENEDIDFSNPDDPTIDGMPMDEWLDAMLDDS